MKRLKCMIYGDTGLKKTRTALAFPAPYVLDYEGGTDWYTEEFGLKDGVNLHHPTSRADLVKHIERLAGAKHGFKTLILDPVTAVWEIQVAYWTEIFKAKRTGVQQNKGDFYELTPRDWGILKEDWKKLLRSLTALDMSVILTVREKTKYKDSGLMVSDGVTFDAEKNLAYWPDVVLRYYGKKVAGKSDQVMATVVKDRTFRLPKEDFEPTYAVFAGAYKELLTTDAKPVALEPLVIPDPDQAPPLESSGSNIHPIMADVLKAVLPTVKPNGITPSQVSELVRLVGPNGLKMRSEDLDKALARYGAKSIDDLSEATAAGMISKAKARLGK